MLLATMGIDTGEIATAVIVPSQKASYYSHTCELAAGRPNIDETSFLNILLSANEFWLQEIRLSCTFAAYFTTPEATVIRNSGKIHEYF